MNTTNKATPSSANLRFSSVLDLVKATASDDQIDAFEQYLADTQIVKTLIRTRASAGLTQSDVATRMDCSQSSVSKLEHGSDGDLTLREITSYLRATGGNVEIGFGKQPSLVERIKDSAMNLKQDLDELANLSANTDDSKIRKSIDSFFGEAWFNLFLILCDSTEKLPVNQVGHTEPPVKILRSDKKSSQMPEILEHACR